MASTLGFVILLSACLFVTVTALNCYTCTNCDKSIKDPQRLAQTSQMCPSGVMGMAIPQCFHEITATGALNRGCTNRSDCSARSTQRMERQCALPGQPAVQPPCFSCCETDNCNVGNGASMSKVTMATFLLILVPSILSMLVSW